MQTAQQQPAGVALLLVSVRGICLTVCGRDCLMLRVSLTKTCALVPAVEVLVVVRAVKVLRGPLHDHVVCPYWVVHMQPRALVARTLLSPARRAFAVACVLGAGACTLRCRHALHAAHHLWPSTGYGCEYVSGIRCWLLAWCMNAVCVWLRCCRWPAAPALAWTCMRNSPYSVLFVL
jgi:hypothetical protein